MKKKIILYCLMMMLFIVYLMNANSIMLLDNNRTEEIKDAQLLLGNTVTTAYIDCCYSMDDMLENVYFQGWAFSDTDLPYENRKMGILLVNEDGKCFLSTTDTFGGRPDVMATYQSKGRLLEGVEHGFSLFFSTLELKDGRYGISVYCYENSESYGFDPTSNVLIKNGKQIQIEQTGKIQWKSTIVTGIDVNGVKLIGDAQIYLDKNNVDKLGNLIVSGWAYLPDKNAAKQKVYALVTDPDGNKTLFNCLRKDRADVAEYYSNPQLTMSGYYASIPSELLHSKEYTVSILLEDEEGIHTSSQMLSANQKA